MPKIAMICLCVNYNKKSRTICPILAKYNCLSCPKLGIYKHETLSGFKTLTVLIESVE